MPAAAPQAAANPFYNHLAAAAPAALPQLQIPPSSMATTGIPVSAGSLQVAAHQQVQQHQQVPQQVQTVQQVQPVQQAAGIPATATQATATAGGVPAGWWQYM